MDDERGPRGPPDGRPQSTTRVYVGNLPPNVQKSEVEDHFHAHSSGKIGEVKLMNGFGFLEYDDPRDAQEVIPALHGTDFMGQRLTVQPARGPRDRERAPPQFFERSAPRTRRTQYRMTMSGLPPETSWQDLKDFARMDGLDVVYSEIPRERDGTGFVEYETEADLNNAVSKIDGRDFRGAPIQCTAVIQAPPSRDGRFRSRSPPPYRRGYDAPPRGGYEDYDRRGPPRPYSGRGYRDRSPPPARRSYYDDREGGRGGYGGRSPPPPRGGRGPPPPMDDYPPRRGAYPPSDDYPPPARGYGRGPPPYADDPYAGPRGGYDRPPSPGAPPPRRRSPPPARGGGYDAGYDRRGYW